MFLIVAQPTRHKMLRAIKIDVVNRTITEVFIESGINAIYKQLDCRMFECVDLGDNQTLYLDEEGLLLDEPLGAFMFKGMLQPYSGHGLILGTNPRTGDTVSCHPAITVEVVKKLVEFAPVQLLKGIPLEAKFIGLTNEEFDEYMRTGEIPQHKQPANPQ